MFKIEFTRCDAGWIDFIVSYKEIKCNYTFSYCYSSPRDLLDWAEQIYNGNYQKYENDSEGWKWFFDYDGKTLTISDTMNLKDENPDNDKYPRIKIDIEKEVVCKTIYDAIKQFQKSGKYIPREWESLSLNKILETCYGTIERAIDILSRKSIAEIIDDIKSNPAADELGFCIVGFFEDEDYDNETPENRIKLIKEYLSADYDYGGFDGEPVMEIKSELFDKAFSTTV